MKKKALIAVLLAAACLATGCSSSKKETEAPAKVETEASKAETEAAKVETEAAAAAEEAVSEAVDAAAEALTEVEAAGESALEGAAEAVSEAVADAGELSSEAEAVVGEAASEAEAAVEEAASEAEAVVGEAASEAEAVVGEAASEAEAAVEEAASEAEAVMEGMAAGAAAAATELMSEAETLTEETEIVENAVEAIAGLASEPETDLEAVSEEMTETVLEQPEDETAAIEMESEEAVKSVEIVELGEKPSYKALDYVTLGAYKGLAVEVTKAAEITDEDVENEMNLDVELEVEEKELFDKITEGTIAEGDIVNIDYEGKIDGEAFDGGTGNYDLEIGSGSFIEGFEEKLVGVKIGDTVDLELTFPKDYYEELAGKDVVFTVTANYIKKTPELTDELVSKMTDGKYTTIDAYREFEKEELTRQNEESQKSEAYGELMNQLFNTSTISAMPEDLIDYTLDSAHNQYIQMAQMYGMTYEDLVSAYGLDQETFDQYLREDIESSLKQELILNAIAEQENITISDEEYQEGAQNYAEMYGYDSVEAFEQTYPKSDITASLLMNKVMEFVRENAVVTEVEPSTEDLDLVGNDEIEYFEEETDEFFEYETDDYFEDESDEMYEEESE